MSRPQRIQSTCKGLFLWASSTFLLLAALLPTSVHAQLTSSTITGDRSSSASSTLTSPSEFSSSSRQPSASLSLRSSSVSNAILSTHAPAASNATHPVLSSTNDTPSEAANSQGKRDNLLNYYFLLLAILVIIIIVGYWLLHRRRKKKVARVRNSGQNALARDLDGWAPRSRWMYGGWRGVMGGHARHEEGLDEHGEAPPPYQPRSSHPSTAHGESTERIYDFQNHEFPDHGGSSIGRRPSASTVSIPMRTLSREAIGREPPNYEETLGNSASRESITPRHEHPDTERSVGIESPSQAIVPPNEHRPAIDPH